VIMALSLACVTAALQLIFLADVEQFIIGRRKANEASAAHWQASCSVTEDSLTCLVHAGEPKSSIRTVLDLPTPSERANSYDHGGAGPLNR
jgi:hypothetical protein